VIYTLTYVAFLTVGGVMIGIIEDKHENSLKSEARRLKNRFLRKYPNINSEWKCTNFVGEKIAFAGTDLEALLSSAQSYNADGISMLSHDEKADNWSFGQSVLFTVTVVTTIGVK